MTSNSKIRLLWIRLFSTQVHVIIFLDKKMSSKNVIENGNQELFFFKNMQFADTGHSFDALLLYGHEFSLTIFDVLVFSFVDLLVQDYLIAAIITFFVGKVSRTTLR